MKWKLHIRRKLFFLLDHWHVPRAERVWLVIMMAISVGAWSAQALMKHPEGIWKQKYTQERKSLCEGAYKGKPFVKEPTKEISL